jgi:thymidylate kinase
MNLFLSFSGIDSSGKSTQIDIIRQYYLKQGKEIILRWSRGGYTPIMMAIKSFLLSSASENNKPRGINREKAFKSLFLSKLWLKLAIYDLTIYYGIWYRILALKSDVVVADRYLWDTMVDFKMNFPGIAFESWYSWKLLCKFHKKPDISIILSLDASESLQRSIRKKEPFMENEDTRLKRILLYKELIDQGKWNNVVDARPPIDEVAKILLKAIKSS